MWLQVVGCVVGVSVGVCVGGVVGSSVGAVVTSSVGAEVSSSVGVCVVPVVPSVPSVGFSVLPVEVSVLLVVAWLELLESGV